MIKKTIVRKTAIIFTALISFLTMTGCSTDNVTVTQDIDSAVTYNETAASEGTEADITETQSETSDNPYTDDEISKPEKAAEKRLELISSTDFYGFNTDTPYRAAGSGPEKPEGYVHPEYYYYCSNASIQDPVLLKMINDFYDESRKSITADFDRLAAYYDLNFEADSIMSFLPGVSVINGYCIAVYECRFSENSKHIGEFRLRTGNTVMLNNTVFELRCAYFDISEHRRLELSDLFFKDCDFTSVINRNVHQSMEYDGNTNKFYGLNQESMMIYPEASYGSWTLKSPMLCPYPAFSCHPFSGMNLYDNSCLYYKPVKYDSDVFTGSVTIKDISDGLYVTYGTDENYPGMLKCPVESTVLDDETLQNIRKTAYDEFGELVYPDPSGDWASADQIRCALCINYLKDCDIFEVYIDHNLESCRLTYTKKFYDARTLKELSADEIFDAVIGEDWRNHYDIDTENISPDYLFIYTDRTEADRFVRKIHSVLNMDTDIIQEFRLEDGKWIPEYNSKNKEVQNK